MGNRLLAEVVERLIAADVPALTLWTMSWNTQSQQFYERRGFVATGKSEPTALIGSSDENENEIPYEIVEYKKRLINA